MSVDYNAKVIYGWRLEEDIDEDLLDDIDYDLDEVGLCHEWANGYLCDGGHYIEMELIAETMDIKKLILPSVFYEPTKEQIEVLKKWFPNLDYARPELWLVQEVC